MRNIVIIGKAHSSKSTFAKMLKSVNPELVNIISVQNLVKKELKKNMDISDKDIETDKVVFDQPISMWLKSTYKKYKKMNGPYYWCEKALKEIDDDCINIFVDIKLKQDFTYLKKNVEIFKLYITKDLNDETKADFCVKNIGTISDLLIEAKALIIKILNENMESSILNESYSYFLHSESE